MSVSTANANETLPICLVCVMMNVCKNIKVTVGLQYQKSSAYRYNHEHNGIAFCGVCTEKVASQAELCTKGCTAESTDPTALVSEIMGYTTIDLSSNKAVNWGIKHESAALDLYHDKHSSESQNVSAIRCGLLIDKVADASCLTVNNIMTSCGRGLF